MSVSQGVLPFKIESEDSDSRLTSHAGIPLVVETFHALGLSRAIRDLFGTSKSHNGYSPDAFIEAFVAAFAAGARSVEDVSLLASDKALASVLNRESLPAESSLHRFLLKFHTLPQWTGGAKGAAIVPEESPWLKALASINQSLVFGVGRRLSRHTSLTVDLDATIIESHKEEALPHYDGGRGYQPFIAMCPELGLVIHDQFRDGNVPASYQAKQQVQAAFEAIPASLKKGARLYFRADSALYDNEALLWMARQNIEFAVSADMSPQLRARIDQLPESAWQPLYKTEIFGPALTNCHIAEVEFCSTESSTSKKDRPFRYIAIRKVDDQNRLFPTEDQRAWHLAVVTNRKDLDPTALWWWHREKCGTVELVHDQLKNDLAAGVLPSGRFQVNAAWFRLNVLAFNLITALKRLGLPDELAAKRPASLRYRLFNLAGRLIHRSGSLFLRLPLIPGLFDLFKQCRDRLVHVHQKRVALAA